MLISARYQDVKFSCLRGGGQKNLDMLLDLSHASLPEDLQGVRVASSGCLQRRPWCWILVVLDYNPAIGPQVGVQEE